MAQFTPQIITSVSNGILTVTDVSNYDTNDEGYYKSQLYVRTITVKDSILGLNSVTKPLSYGNDSATFDLSLLETLSVIITLYQRGQGFNIGTDFTKNLNI